MEQAQYLNQIQSSYIRDILAAATDRNIISLAGGLPDGETFPIELMKQTLGSLADRPGLFQYGATAGYEPLLQHLAGRFDLPETHAVIACTGSQQGLDLIARAYINPGDTVVMEAPSYLGAMQVFGLAQASIVTVPQTESGVDIRALEDCFRQKSPKLFYAVPDFHNPTGVCWALETRIQVASLCEKYNVVLIEDAPYRELRFAGEVVPLVSDFCRQTSIVLRSFSKTASPGLRMGAVMGKQSYIAPLIKVKQVSDLHSSVPMQALLLGLLEHPDFESHMQRICALYQSRCNTLLSELRRQLPDSCVARPVDGGMFVWLSLPHCDTFALAKTMLANGVAVVPSPVFYAQPEAAPSALRLNFTNASSETLRLAVTRLAEVLKETMV